MAIFVVPFSRIKRQQSVTEGVVVNIGYQVLTDNDDGLTILDNVILGSPVIEDVSAGLNRRAAFSASFSEGSESTLKMLITGSDIADSMPNNWIFPNDI